MGRVIGVGGYFFKARDPKALQAWYAEHLGLPVDAQGYIVMRVGDEDPRPHFVWSPFPEDTTYFGPGPQTSMLNFRVDDLNGLLAKLREAGVTVDDKVEEMEFGRFGWVVDPEGNRVELWQPAPGF